MPKLQDLPAMPDSAPVPLRPRPLLALLGMLLALPAAPAAAADRAAAPPPAASQAQLHRHRPAHRHRTDHSGRAQVGKASVYSRRFAGKAMADGAPMDPHDDNAASKTLPLGTRARVTNLDNGRSATVTIEDRGPYVKGRIVDVSPATARQLGIRPKQGIAPVELAPIAVPQPDGRVTPGAGAEQAPAAAADASH